jgi:hypothetical protein
MIGVPGPRLLPEFSPVIESTEFGRSLPRRVASDDRLANLLPHPDLVRAKRDTHLERRHAGVLANRPFAVRREIDVLGDDRQCLGGAGVRGLRIQRGLHRGTTSGGRSVDVLTMSCRTLSKNAGSIPKV